MTSRPHVTCVGLVTLDLRQVVARLPGRNEKTVADSAVLEFGGPAANAAATAAELGAEATLVTGCGGGPVGRLVLDGLQRVGVRVVDLATADEPGPAVSSVLVDRDSGDRAVVSTNAAGVPVDTARLPGPTDAGCLLVDGHHMTAALEAAAAARAHGVPVLLDGGSWKPGTDRLLRLVDLAVLSADFQVPGGGDPVGVALASGCGAVAVSRGAGPVAVHTQADRRPSLLPVPEVELVDTVGAGDVLHGAAAYALALGADPVTDVEPVLRFATGLASLSCAYPGARGWAADPGARRAAADLVAALG